MTFDETVGNCRRATLYSIPSVTVSKLNSWRIGVMRDNF